MLSTLSGSVRMGDIFSSEGPDRTGHINSQNSQGEGNDNTLNHMQQEPPANMVTRRDNATHGLDCTGCYSIEAINNCAF